MRFLHPAILAPAALLLTCAPAALAAQAMVQALPGTTDADRLAEQMRALAANPRDLNALVAAADLSLMLGDLSGAASLYARAEKVSARDPRIKAGEGAILVRSERPGEALRYFAQAEAAGYDPRGFAADRGLAYDLIGQQERAQRDYRLALKTRPDDEIVRRYALSLGIAGKRDAALEQLDPLVRKNDRSAWRVRAFVLAMGGDQAGAEKIATTMLPAGMAQGLLPFFQRLPSLPAADRAFAVHFGEVHATPERLADARLAPVLPQLSPEPSPVALAAMQPAARPGKVDRRSRNRREATPDAVRVASATTPTRAPAASAPATGAPAASTPSYRAVTQALASVQPLPRTAPVTLAAATPPNAAPAAPSFATRSPVATPSAITGVASPVPSTSQPVRVASAAPVVQPVPASAASARPAATVEALPASGATLAATPAAVPPPAASYAAPPSRAEADSVLARIVAGLSIPASELGVVEPVPASSPTAVPPPDTAARVIAEARAKEARDAAAEKALAAKTLADRRAAERKAVADKKALAAKKLADEKKQAEAKAAAEEKKLARANPERIWVQVASGAYEGDLPKAYAAAKSKAPAVFGSRAGWSTPLRATNRVLAGPFKTDAEARSFVNQLAKEGVAASTFTSDAGQVVTRLGGKSGSATARRGDDDDDSADTKSARSAGKGGDKSGGKSDDRGAAKSGKASAKATKASGRSRRK